MARNGPPGVGTANRLASRLDRSQLTRVSMPGGGEVFKGPVASRALKALGARAMTVDRSIIVSDGFNASRAEDAALYAHERHHLARSGGQGGHHGRDEEEREARAVEAMVFHRMSGGYEGGYGPGGNDRPTQNAWDDNSQNSQAKTSGTQGGNDKSDATAGSPSPGRGYAALRAQGYSHMDVVDEMSRRVQSSLDEQEQVKTDRFQDVKAWT